MGRRFVTDGAGVSLLGLVLSVLAHAVSVANRHSIVKIDIYFKLASKGIRMAITPSRKLHHLCAPGIIQHVTFRLNDSLPQSAVRKIEQSLVELPETTRNSTRSKQLHSLLDQGVGSCLLRADACAAIIENSLLFGHLNRYKLLAWCVMPNHVHVLFEQIEDWGIDRVVHGWKRHTAREIGKLGYQTGNVDTKFQVETGGIWQRNYWDRYVRNSEHLVKVKWYIEQNPVRAGLVERAEAWRWSSAFERG